MNKGLRLIKRAIALVLVLLLSIESFAAVVSDNDGSAFITKGEFDSLKNSFQSQIDQYNTSIDSKIDGAIAAYLAGINIAKEVPLVLADVGKYHFPLTLYFDDKKWSNYKSAYYDVAIPELHTNYIEVKLEDQKETATDENDGFYVMTPEKVATYTGPQVQIPATTRSYPPANREIVRTIIKRRVWDLPGQSAEIANIVSTSATRSVGGSNKKVFDIKTRGRGNQIIFYQPYFNVRVGNLDGEKNSGGFIWLALNIAGGSWNKSGTTITYTPQEYSSLYTRIQGRHMNTNMTNYNNWETMWSSISKVSDLSAWTGSMYGDNIDIASTFSQQNTAWHWDNTNYVSKIYAYKAYAHAELDGYFGLTGDNQSGIDTPLTYKTIDNSYGQSYGTIFNYSNSAQTVPLSLWKLAFLYPVFETLNFGNDSNYHKSSWPAFNLRYIAEDGEYHFLDEGLYLKTFDAVGKVSFRIKFVSPKASTESVKVYVSKEPFSYDNGLTKLIQYTINNGTTQYTSYSVNTGETIKVNIDQVSKGESLYLCWTCNNDVALDSFTDFVMIQE